MIAGFIVFPLVWSVPEALITAELATAFPENSGYVAWVSAAFGPFWGFQEGWWSWLSGVADNSIYPVMLADNLRLFFPALGGGWQRCARGARVCWGGSPCVLMCAPLTNQRLSSHAPLPPPPPLPAPPPIAARPLSCASRWA